MIKSFKWAINGLGAVWKEERNFRLEIYIGIIAILVSILLEISKMEFIFIIISITMIILGEIINTAIEDICNKIEPNQNPEIGKIKDMMAGFVLISSISSAIIGLIIFIPYLL